MQFVEIAQVIGTLVIIGAGATALVHGPPWLWARLMEWRAERASRVPAERTQPHDGERWLEGASAADRARELALRKEFAEAVKQYDLAVERGFDEPPLYAERGMCLQKLGFDLDAIDDFDRAVAQEPDDSNIYFMRAASKSSSGDLAGGVADIEQAISVSEIDNDAQRSHEAGAREMGHPNLRSVYEGQLVLARIVLAEQLRDENRKREFPTLPVADIATERRANAKRRSDTQA